MVIPVWDRGGRRFCLSKFDNAEFDGDLENLRLMWKHDRMDLIQRGLAEPIEEELHQWCQALCHRQVENLDGSSVAWVVPLWIGSDIAGYALFLCGDYVTPEDSLELAGIFENVEEAKSALSLEGPIHGL